MTKTAVITGVARGIGNELAKQLVGAGWTVAGTVRDDSEVEGVQTYQCELTDEEQVASAAKAIAQDHPKIDLLINNAGIYNGALGSDSASKLVSFEAFQRILTVNVISPVAFTQHLKPNLSDNAQVAVVSSGLGCIEGKSDPGHLTYGTSKSAVNMAFKTLAADLDAQVIILHPGWVSTDMGGSSAPVKPAESAAKIIDLIEREKGSETGQFFNAITGDNLPW